MPELLDRWNNLKLAHSALRLAAVERSGYHHAHFSPMSETRNPADNESSGPSPRKTTRPLERFWPYVVPSEEPTAEELAELDPDLHDVLFGPRDRPFSMTLIFSTFEADDYDRALALARKAPEYQQIGIGGGLRHRALFFTGDALALRDLFEIVGRYDDCQVLVDDRAVPFARELWLPLMWLLIRRD